MKIECTHRPLDGGAPSPANVAGTEYSFHRDVFGRFVTDVFNPQHIRCLLAVEHYREAAENPEPEQPAAPELEPQSGDESESEPEVPADDPSPEELDLAAPTAAEEQPDAEPEQPAAPEPGDEAKPKAKRQTKA